ncbi:hypothetical protein HZS_7135 [Henneguya salminicola]|nr:hypothetical protein HZS_7135 [Henneguya salminicola]
MFKQNLIAFFPVFHATIMFGCSASDDYKNKLNLPNTSLDFSSFIALCIKLCTTCMLTSFSSVEAPSLWQVWKVPHKEGFGFRFFSILRSSTLEHPMV